MNHLLLHCSYAYNLWTFVFSLFGVSSVMPKQVVNLPACWNRAVRWCQIAVVWGVILLCLMGTIWREQNHPWVETVLFAFFVWLDYSFTFGFFWFVYFCLVFCIPSVHGLCTHGSILYFFYFLLIKFSLPINNKQSLSLKILGSAMDSQ